MHQLVEEHSENRLMIMKLTNGETIIGNVSKETQGYVEVSLPFKLITFFNQRGNMNLSIIKWDFTIDFDYPVRIFKPTIVACGKPNDQMIQSYRELIENGFDTNGESEEEETTTEQDLESIEEKIAEVMKQLKGSKLH